MQKTPHPLNVSQMKVNPARRPSNAPPNARPAPHVYRPQPLPKVLQTKANQQASVGSFTRPAPASKPSTVSTRSPRNCESRSGSSIQLAAAKCLPVWPPPTARTPVTTTTTPAWSPSAETLYALTFPPAPTEPASSANTSSIPPPPPGPVDLGGLTNYRTDAHRAAFKKSFKAGLKRYVTLLNPDTLPERQVTFENSYMTEADPTTGAMTTTYLKQTRLPDGRILYEPQTSYGYQSRVDLERGDFHAEVHKRSPNPEIAGSEVIFGQYRHMASHKGVPIPPLKRLIRHGVISESGKPVVEYIHGNSDRAGSTRRFTPSNPEFYSLVGTENLSSAVYLVKQRGKELGISRFRRITLAGSKVIVHFEPR